MEQEEEVCVEGVDRWALVVVRSVQMVRFVCSSVGPVGWLAD